MPVVYKKLGQDVSGAVLQSRGIRSIVINSVVPVGAGGTRRVTLGHELCHALLDTASSFMRVKVGARLGGDPPDSPAYLLECRAQAFSAELLLQAKTARKRYEQGGRGSKATFGIMEAFGVSFTTARTQVRNGFAGSKLPHVDELEVTPPTSRWDRAELPGDATFVAGVRLNARAASPRRAKRLSIRT